MYIKILLYKLYIKNIINLTELVTVWSVLKLFKLGYNWFEVQQKFLYPLFVNIHSCVQIGDSDVCDIVMLVTLWWRPIWEVGDRIIMLVTFFVMLVIFPMY